MASKLIKNIGKDLENESVQVTALGDILGKQKFYAILIYPDGSYKTFKTKLKSSYYIELDKSLYFIDYKSIIRGKANYGFWYFNNPSPIRFGYQESKISSKSFYEGSTVESTYLGSENVFIDAKAMHSAMNNNIISKMYAENNQINAKMILIAGAVIIVIILVLLQSTGQVDVMSWIQGK